MSDMTSEEKRSKRERLRVLLGDRCHWCGRVMEFSLDKRSSKLYATIDHVVPKSWGGSNKIKNLVLACFKCNKHRGASGDMNFRPRWAVIDKEGNMRKLASIQRITDIQPIPGADAIEVASVLGWKVVVKKGEFAVGDLAVYMEIDSVPPDEEPYRFLWKNAEERPNNYRLRTVKLRGQVSQGILFSSSVFSDKDWAEYVPLEEGYDVTDLLGVTKYDPPLPAGSDDIEGQFFDGVPKTDEERVQSETGARHLEALQGKAYYITVKCDGSSMTVAMHNGVAKVGGRNYRLRPSDDSPYYRAARSAGLLEFVEAHPNLAIQGELVGPGIQGNRLDLTDYECRVFNIYDRDMGMYLSWVEMEEMLPGRLVPLIIPPTFGFSYAQEELLALAEGKYEGTTNEREGIVIRSVDPYERISFKAISNRYLLRGGE